MMELQIIATLVITCLDVWMSSIFHKANNLMLRGPLISRCFPPNELANMLERICRKLGTIIYELVIATKLGLDQQSSFCQVLQTERKVKVRWKPWADEKCYDDGKSPLLRKDSEINYHDGPREIFSFCNWSNFWFMQQMMQRLLPRPMTMMMTILLY